MATLYITEYTGTQNLPIAETPAIAQQNLTISGASNSCQPFNSNTAYIRVHTDAICSLQIGGLAPVATTASPRMPADATEYFSVRPGDKLAVITNT